MAKPDKNQSAADKIIKDWMKKAKYYKEACAGPSRRIGDSMKEVADLKRESDRGVSGRMEGAPLEELKEYRINFEAALKYHNRQVKEMDLWFAKGPKQGMDYIDKKLKLGGKRAKPYLEIEKIQTKPLKEIEKIVGEVHKFWEKSLKGMLLNYLKDLDILTQIAKRR